MIVDKESFGRWLKNERECRGIPLAAIAESTKIRLPLLAALERGDLRNWPLGVYRRDFFRQYANAIGLPAEPLVAQFLRVCPEDGIQAPCDRPVVEIPDEDDGLRLRLAERDWRHVRSFAPAVLRAIAEWCAALVLVAFVIRFFQANLWAVAAFLASLHCLVMIGLGRRLGLSWRDVQVWRNGNEPAFRLPRSAAPSPSSPIDVLASPVRAGEPVDVLSDAPHDYAVMRFALATDE